MRAVRWILVEALLALAALALGWLIPDGLNDLAGALGQTRLTVAPTERLLSSMVVFLFTATLQLILLMRSEAHGTQRELQRLLGDAVTERTAAALDSSLVPLLLDVATDHPATLSGVRDLLRSTLAPLVTVRGYLRLACLVLVERALADANRNMQRLGGEGVDIDIAAHVEITRRLATASGSYAQIQRRAFLVPEEWTQEWLRLVADLPPGGTRCQYIVLMDATAARRQQTKLDSMDRHLTRVGWAFKYCDLRDVLDSLGGVLPTEWNVDVFDDKVAKLQELPAGRYQGGITLRMTMFDLERNAHLRRFVASVSASAVPYPGHLFSGRPANGRRSASQ